MTFKQSNRPRRHSGIALIIVLLVITVLAILAGGFAYSMKVETQLARNASFDDELFWLAWGGLEKAKWILAQDMQGPCAQYDSLKDGWAGGQGCDQLTEPVPPPENRLETDRGIATWTIVDAERKFNINVVGQPPVGGQGQAPAPGISGQAILQQALTLVGLDPASHSTIMDSIVDWIDPNDVAGTSGAENEFYQSGQGPYGIPHTAKNGPMDDISELLMINGITRAIYEGSGGIDTTAPLATVAAARSRFDEPIYAVGLRDLFCTVSSRTLNINTASATALQLLPPVDANVAAEIIRLRDETPFRSIDELATTRKIPGLPPPVLEQLRPYIGVRSQVFEVTIEANIGGLRRTYVGVVARINIQNIQVLSFAPKWE